MADSNASTTALNGSALVLVEADRKQLDILRDGIAERSDIRAARVEARARNPEDTKRARLERNQERLEQLFEDAVAQPTISAALGAAGYDVDGLRQAGSRSTWARDVVPALEAIRPSADRAREDQQREAIGEAARAMVEIGIDRRPGKAEVWLDDLEEQVRASLGSEAKADQVADRLVAWAEEAMRAVPGPVAVTARAVLVHKAYEVAIDAEGDGGDRAFRDALKVSLERDEQARLGRNEEDGRRDERRHRAAEAEQETGPREPNRISVADEAETAPAERQVEAFSEPARPEESSAPSLFGRMRDYVLGRERPNTFATSQPVQEDDGIPEALRRRYAVHVSPDARTIELFEAGAKTAAITLDARTISTPHDAGVVIADVVALARDRGWQSLKVAGTAEFKDAIWLEANKAGLTVQHQPSSAAQAAYAKWNQERPANQVQDAAPAPAPVQRDLRRDDLAQAFAAKTAEERLADPRLRNAQLELMVGLRTAERELKRPIAEMPEVAQALTAAIREQLAGGKMFEAPFVKPEAPRATAKQVTNPRIEADRIPPPRV